MKKKIFLTLLFIIFILLILNINNISSAFTYTDDRYGINADFGDIKLNNYTIISYFEPLHQLNIYSFIDMPYVKKVKDYYFLYNNFSGYVSYLYNLDSNNLTLQIDCTSTDSDYLLFGLNRPDDSVVIYSDIDLCDKDGNFVFSKDEFNPSKKFELNLSINPSEKTTNLPVVISTQDFTFEEIQKYILYYSTDGNNYKECDVRTINYIQEGSVGHQYYINVYNNGCYHLKFVNTETDEEIVSDVNIMNIVVTQDNVYNYVDGVFKPTPFLSYEYFSDSEVIITTQKFFIYELEKLECSYKKILDDEDLDLEGSEGWTNLSIRSFYNELARKETYQFFTSISNENGDADGTYCFRFYNKELDEYTIATLNLNFSNIVAYQNSLDKGNALLQKYLSFFKERFGFLIYPFELFVNILQKIGNINFETPKFSIPDIYEPFTNVKIISSVNFNFNDLLKNDVLKNVHDIYLVVVDVLIIFALLNLFKNKIMGVFEK